MKKNAILLVCMLLLILNTYADEISFPPELLWWIAEFKKVDKNMELSNFELKDTKIIPFSENNGKKNLKYPVFMRWNYSGNYMAYYNYHDGSFRKNESGKYESLGGDDSAFLVFTDRNKKIFFFDYFGIAEGLDSIQWLTDTVLVGVGYNIYNVVQPFITIYKINESKKTVEIRIYYYNKTISIIDENTLKLKWFEQRPDYFEIK
jgi:hypothetical protein